MIEKEHLKSNLKSKEKMNSKFNFKPLIYDFKILNINKLIELKIRHFKL